MQHNEYAICSTQLQNRGRRMKKEKCPTCGGTRRVEGHYTHLSRTEEWDDCPDCVGVVTIDGAGRVKARPPKWTPKNG